MTQTAHIRRRTAETTDMLTDMPVFLARIYANRGIKDARELSCSLNDLLPYHGLKGIDTAVDVLAPMLIAQKRFLIIGDFDADGATATSVGVRALKMLGAKHVDFLVPNRFEYGYGLTPEIVVEAAKRSPDVIITVDNGISSIDGVAHANALGIPVVVTDHHLAGHELPVAAAIVNPNQPGCLFASKSLAGVGVIFYVMLAMRARLREMNVFEGAGPNLAELLDIVAMGTVADLVPLDQNNRILVKQGLMRIRKGHACPGIQALLKVSGREPARVNAQDFGFALGPRINAAGRLEDMSIGIACLLSETIESAMPLAEELDTLNGERKNIEADMQAQAEVLLRQFLPALSLPSRDIVGDLGSLPPLKGLVGAPHEAPISGVVGAPRGLSLYNPTWHIGVVGILASRVKEAHHRPVICFAKGADGLLKGSARSVSGVHIRDVLDRVSTENPGLILKFGGHAMAAGLTIEEAGYDIFSKAFAATVGLFLKEEDCMGVHWSDGALEPHEITLETARALDLAGPFGSQFPAPLFDNEFTVISRRSMGGDKHMRYVMAQPGRVPVEAVHFGVKPEEIAQEGQQVHLVYSLELNHFRGNEKLQLRVDCLNKS